VRSQEARNEGRDTCGRERGDFQPKRSWERQRETETDTHLNYGSVRSTGTSHNTAPSAWDKWSSQSPLVPSSHKNEQHPLLSTSILIWRGATWGTRHVLEPKAANKTHPFAKLQHDVQWEAGGGQHHLQTGHPGWAVWGYVSQTFLQLWVGPEGHDSYLWVCFLYGAPIRQGQSSIHVGSR